MRGLTALDEWAASWQSESWDCASLTRDLGANLIVVSGGTSILGASLRDDWAIGLNERIIDSELERPVILHEAGHLLTQPRSALISGCDQGWNIKQAGETLAWCGAGRLSVSIRQGDLLDRHEATLLEVAAWNGVPPELVNIGLAILHQLHRPLGPLHAGALAEQRLELHRALDYWHVRMAAAASQLMGRRTVLY